MCSSSVSGRLANGNDARSVRDSERQLFYRERGSISSFSGSVPRQQGISVPDAMALYLLR